ncbi:MAG: hypothetical protein ACO3JL_11230, partial [Myxococcota bacterium]
MPSCAEVWSALPIDALGGLGVLAASVIEVSHAGVKVPQRCHLPARPDWTLVLLAPGLPPIDLVGVPAADEGALCAGDDKPRFSRLSAAATAPL